MALDTNAPIVNVVGGRKLGEFTINGSKLQKRNGLDQLYADTEIDNKKITWKC